MNEDALINVALFVLTILVGALVFHLLMKYMPEPDTNCAVCTKPGDTPLPFLGSKMFCHKCAASIMRGMNEY